MSQEYNDERPENEGKKVRVNIEVDNSQIQQVMNENETLKADHAEFETAKAMLEDMKLKASTELSELGIPTQTEDIKTKEDLDRAVLTIRKLKGSQPKNYYDVSSGNAPLQGQYQGKSDNQTFGSHKELVDNLVQRMHSGDKEAKKIYDALMVKAIKGIVDAGKRNQIVESYDSSKDEESDVQKRLRFHREQEKRNRGMT